VSVWLQLKLDLVPSRFSKRHMALAAGARKRGHDRTYGNRSSSGNFLVSPPFQFTKQDHLTEAWRQRLKSIAKALAIVIYCREGFGCSASESLQIQKRQRDAVRRATRSASDPASPARPNPTSLKKIAH
jgi:hypothetical protein